MFENTKLEQALDHLFILINEEYDYDEALYKTTVRYGVNVDSLQQAFESIEGKPLSTTQKPY